MATRERVNHTIKNVLWTYVYSGVGSVFPFIIRSLIIRYFGMEYLGLNSFYSSILQVLNVSELGIGQALVISMYMPASKGDTQEVNKLLSLYAKFYHILGIGIGIVGCALVPFLSRIVNGEYPENVNILIVYLIYLAQSVLGYFVFPYCNAAFIANQNVEKINKYQSIIWTVIYGVQIIAICIGHSYYMYLILMPVATLLCGIVNRMGMKVYFPQYYARQVKREEFDKTFWNSFIKRMSAMALSKFRIVFRSSIDTIIMATFMGVVVVAKYQNYILTMTVPLLLISSLTAGILPSLGNSVALESIESNLAVTRLISFMIHWIGTVFSTFLMCFYQPFMALWAGEESLFSELTVAMFVIYFYLRTISEISILVRNSSGVWWEGKWIAIVESLVNFGLNIVFVQIWGVEGILLATIISMLIINIPFETYYVYKYYFKIMPWKDLLRYLIDGCIAFITVTITYYITKSSCKSYENALVVMGIECIFIPNIILFLFHCKNEKFKRLVEIVIQGLQKEKR